MIDVWDVDGDHQGGQKINRQFRRYIDSLAPAPGSQ